MKINSLIIGGTGQDGTILHKKLTDLGDRVLVTSRAAVPKPSYVQLDVSNRCSIKKVLESFLPEEIYLMTGQSSVGRSFSFPDVTYESFANVTINVFEACREIGLYPKVFLPLSSEMFGNNASHGAIETTPFEILSPYSLGKQAAYNVAEYYRAVHDFAVVYAFFFNHESILRPGQYVTAKVAKGAVDCHSGKMKKLVLGDLSIERDWGWADEYMSAAISIMRRGKYDRYVVATGEKNSLENFVQACFSRLGLDYLDFVEIDSSLFRPAEIKSNFGNPERLLNDLGWRPTHKMRDVVANMVDHYRSSNI